MLVLVTVAAAITALPPVPASGRHASLNTPAAAMSIPSRIVAISLAAALAGFIGASAGRATEISGIPRIVDGDTVQIGSYQDPLRMRWLVLARTSTRRMPG
jgi:endonuclease YncB( thermonuclease family)